MLFVSPPLHLRVAFLPWAPVPWRGKALRTGFELEVHGRLAGLTGSAVFPRMRVGGTLVAEEGLEPPTHGL